MVSVIMITYNHQNYIKEAVEGVLMQICDFDIELIIADDKSPDETESVVDELVKTHHNGHWIRYTRHSHNKGMMPNFIWALSQANGKYIALCEGDDFWLNPLKLQKQINFLEENDEFTFSMGRVDDLNEKSGNITQGRIPVNGKEYLTLKDYVKMPFSQTSSFVFRNSCEPFPDWFVNVHAGDKSLVIIKTGLNGKIRYHNELFSIYRINNSSVTFISNYNVYEKSLDSMFYWHSMLGKDYDLIFFLLTLKAKNNLKISKAKSRVYKKTLIIKINFINFFLNLC